MTFGHSETNTLIKVNTYLRSGSNKACADAGKVTLINSTGLAGFSVSEKGLTNNGEGWNEPPRVLDGKWRDQS